MSRKQAILKGTFILTLTGFATRFMGFFYRVFLSQTFGEEKIGLYQLIFPIYALCFSLTAAGIETALSRCVARRITLGQKKEARDFLYTSLFLTLVFSCIIAFLLQKYAFLLSEAFLKDTRCAKLLSLLSYALPFAAIHSCIVGFYFGLKRTGVPAISQLFEQSARILSVYLIYRACIKHGSAPAISIAVIGLIIGEIVSSAFCVQMILRQLRTEVACRPQPDALIKSGKELLSLSLPLTASRVLLNILQSIESISIPLRLQMHGATASEALSTYGVLTGMALPCILFPSAITNSVSTMLLPTVAEIQALKQRKELAALIRKTIYYCTLLGSICCVFLLAFGQWIGSFLFGSQLAGSFIVTMAWLCPFLYANNTLISIINGIGKTTLSLGINSFSLLLRICSVLFLIPRFGIQGYLWGLLISQISVFLFCFRYLHRV